MTQNPGPVGRGNAGLCLRTEAETVAAIKIPAQLSVPAILVRLAASERRIGDLRWKILAIAG